MKKNLKMRCKRSFALLLALAMCLGTTPSLAFASEGDDVAVESSSDSGSSDTGSSDSGSSDTGSSDSGSSDTGSSDSGSSDTGSSDSGSSDTGSSDSGSSDTGSSDSGSSDVGTSDSSDGSDVSGDAGSDSNSDNNNPGSDSGSNSESDDTNNDGSSQGGSEVDTAEDSDTENGNDADENAEGDVAPGADVDTDSEEDVDVAVDADTDENGDLDGENETPEADVATDVDGARTKDIAFEIVNVDALLNSYGAAPDQSSMDNVTAAMFANAASADSAAGALDEQIMSLADDDPVEEAEPVPLKEDASSAMAETKRPVATDDVEHDIGTKEDKVTPGDKLHIQDGNWDIFYDAEKDVYKITFNIKEGADAEKQVIDLTQALELLGQYSEKQLEEWVSELEKPVKEELQVPEKGKVKVDKPIEPEKPIAPDAPPRPVEPEKPPEPGLSEETQKALDEAYSTLFEKYSQPENNDANLPKNLLVEMEEMGLNTSDKYVQQYAKYIVDKADKAYLIHLFETHGEANKEAYKYFLQWESSYDGRGEPTEEQVRAAIASVKRQDDRIKAPEYEVDKESEAYKAYEIALKKHNDDYKAALEEYEKNHAEWLAEHGEDSEEYQAYLLEMADYHVRLEQYKTAEAVVEEDYRKALAEYETKKAEIEKKYADDQEAYEKSIQTLREKCANVLQPGDVRKFELYLTSDSKHTYKYQSGSFTLATPGWGEQLGSTTGFDGQILPDKYVDRNDYYVTIWSEPVQKLFEAIGMLDPEHPNNTNGMPSINQSNGLIDGYGNYWNTDINDFLSHYKGESLEDKFNAYLLDYYNSQDGTEYKTIDELIQNNPKAQAELTKTTTSGNKWFYLGNKPIIVDAHTETVKYDTFYKQLFSFAFGFGDIKDKDLDKLVDKIDLSKILGESNADRKLNKDEIKELLLKEFSIEKFLGEAQKLDARWEYENKSWTDNGYKNALYYYMDHKEIWDKTDAYFKALLDGGLNAEQATWTSLMMAVNIDGEMTGNDWQLTKWPWYSSIKLDRMDIDFSLTKKDGETGQTITDSETGFQVYYIDKVKNEDGTETSVNMYCTYDETTNSYSFVTTPSTVWTKNGELNISYAMMKDIVYYLQEMTAPEGYERDTNVYIVMSEGDYNKLTDEERASLEGTFDKFLSKLTVNGFNVSTDFVNVKIVTPDPKPENPPTTPDTPRRHRDRTPGTSIPNEPTPLADIPDAAVPLASIPDESVPLTVLLDEDVPLANVPKTGDISSLWFALLALSGIGLLGMAAINGKKSKESVSN